MTKIELIAAIAAAPDDASIYIDPGDGILRSAVTVVVPEPDDEGSDLVILGFVEL